MLKRYYCILACTVCVTAMFIIQTAAVAQETDIDSEQVSDVTETAYPAEWEPALERIPIGDRDLVIDSLRLSGTNIDTHLNVLLSCPDSWLPGAIFLIGNMPVEDLTVVTEEFFMDNLRIAYETRARYEWAGAISESDFLHYVLPMRVSQEPLENWRPWFSEQLGPRLETVTTHEEAVAAAFEWSGSLAGFQQTQRRDQGPFETIASGFGRCEELMILYIDALRAAGIPARQTWAPYWAMMDNNHAWTEFMGSDGTWQNREGWIGGPTSRTNIILSVPFGLPETDSTEIYRIQDTPGARYAIINSIGSYRDATELTINVVDMNGNPMPETDVYISIFNFGALRPIAHGETDENGQWVLEIGAGGCFISAGNITSGACSAFQIPEVEEYEVTMTIGLGAELPPDSFWLRFPRPGEGS